MVQDLAQEHLGPVVPGIVEEATPEEFFDNPVHERTKLFLSQILAH